MTTIEKKRLAQSLFIKSDLNRKQIAQKVGCTEKTLRSWIDKYEWEDIKEAQTITRAKLLQDAYKQLAAINKKIEEEMGGVPNKELSDAKGVIRKEIEALSEMPLHKYVEIATEVTAWLQDKHPTKLMSTVEMLDGFIQYKAQEKGV